MTTKIINPTNISKITIAKIKTNKTASGKCLIKTYYFMNYAIFFLFITLRPCMKKRYMVMFAILNK